MKEMSFNRRISPLTSTWLVIYIFGTVQTTNCRAKTDAQMGTPCMNDQEVFPVPLATIEAWGGQVVLESLGLSLGRIGTSVGYNTIESTLGSIHPFFKGS